MFNFDIDKVINPITGDKVSTCVNVCILYRYVISYVHECSTLSVTAFIAISSYFIHGIYFTTAG